MFRVEARKITDQYVLLKRKGLLSWAAYKEHRESIQASFEFLRLALQRYKDRRLNAGFFYMYANPCKHSVYVMSPLYTMPRKQALKKIRRLLQNGQHYYARASSNTNSTTLSVQQSNVVAPGNIGGFRLMHMFFLHFFVMVLAWMIVYL
jgi:hypothetical protein